MEHKELLYKISAILLVFTGILHLISPLILGLTMEVAGMVAFGIIYLCLGILLFLRDKHKLIALLSILLPAVGALGGLMILTMFYSSYLLFMVILDPVIIFLRILVYKDL